MDFRLTTLSGNSGRMFFFKVPSRSVPPAMGWPFFASRSSWEACEKLAAFTCSKFFISRPPLALPRTFRILSGVAGYS